MSLDQEEIRKRILVALFSDDELLSRLVLKGGNALALVHEVGARASIDMDFSIDGRFVDLDDTSRRLFNELRREFASVGYTLIDEDFREKPEVQRPDQPEWWGGYVVEFKLVDRQLFDQYRGDIETLRRRAEVLGPQQRRTYTIDISKHEFCEGKIRREVNDYTIYVYSLEMIVIEKLRAICQQMPEYELVKGRRPRARDFYDIQQILSQQDMNLLSAENRLLFARIFEAKHVPLNLLGQIARQRSFHEPDWPAVEELISGDKRPFEFYFDYVVNVVSGLQPLWDV